jgi:flagellar hook-associated protein 1
MSLFGSIQMGGNTLQAMDIALQVVGQNIANANTAGYLREEAVLSTAGTQQLGGLLLGTGVDVTAVVQKVDKYLEERLRAATSDASNTDTLQQTYSQLEAVLNALDNSTDLSTAMDTFFNSISDILNSPDDVSVRKQAVLNGQTLTQDISQLSQQVQTLRSSVNDQIKNMAASINQLTDQISKLNVQISQMESSSTSNSTAVGLTDQRFEALKELAGLINIRTVEQNTGAINVYCNGQSLVDGGTSREVAAVTDTSKGYNAVEIHIVDGDINLNPTSGELRGLLDSRDTVLDGFLNQLNDFAQTLTFEFNKIYASGQGLDGYTTLTSQYAVDDAAKALNDTGLTYTPENGSFQVQVTDTTTKLTTTTNIQVNLNGTGHETTLEDLNDALNNIDGIHSQILTNGKLKIDSDSSDTEISFANDTSGVLAALGLNVFFTGTSANDIGVSAAVMNDPSKFAASQGGLGVDTDNAQILANFINQPVESHNNETLGGIYKNITADVAQGSSTAQTNAAGAATFESSLQSKETSISGVNLDEEAVNMLTYQHAYLASSKYISTISGLLDTLMQI